MNNIKEYLSNYKREYYDFGAFKFPVEESDEVLFMLGVTLEEILRDILPHRDTIMEAPYEFKDVFLKNGDTVIDCGANLGLFTALACSKGCKVYSVEPMPKNIESLKKLKNLNPTFDFTILPVAVTNYDGIGKFFVKSNDRGNATIDGNCDIEARQVDTEMNVRMNQIDTLVDLFSIEKVDFIKADIEGAEEFMIEGARNTIHKFKPKLSICTYHKPDSKDVLEKMIKDINPSYTIIQVDGIEGKLYAY